FPLLHASAATQTRASAYFQDVLSILPPSSCERPGRESENARTRGRACQDAAASSCRPIAARPAATTEGEPPKATRKGAGAPKKRRGASAVRVAAKSLWTKGSLSSTSRMRGNASVERGGAHTRLGRAASHAETAAWLAWTMPRARSASAPRCRNATTARRSDG